MIVIGLTGSIGMGKSTTADLLREQGLWVHDSDAEVHKLQADGSPLLNDIEAAFPGVVTGGSLDRKALRERVFGDAAAVKILESIVHPALAVRTQAFFKKAQDSGQWAVVLDIPLLYEVGRDAVCTVVIVCSAPEDVQRARVLDRPGMTSDVLDEILKKQMPDAEKRVRADYIVETSGGVDDARRQVADIITQIKADHGTS